MWLNELTYAKYLRIVQAHSKGCKHTYIIIIIVKTFGTDPFHIQYLWKSFAKP